METTFTIAGPSELKVVADHLARLSAEHRILLFEGGMGAGKTTLIKTLCTGLGVEDDMASPTFSIVNEYASPLGPIYHFDLYRIEHEEELLDLGAEEYLHSGYLCMVEWPELAPSFFSEGHVRIRIVPEGTTRKITVSVPQ